MNIKAFFVDALGGALDLGIGTPDDVLRHVTPELLARHLPRPLWARLFTACLGASRVDAQLVVETIGVPNLCEHIPGTVIWACIAEIGARSLGASYQPAVRTVAPAAPATPPPIEKRSVLSPPPDVMASIAPDTVSSPSASVGPTIPPVNEPLADLISELEQDERPITPQRARTPTNNRFRQSGTGVGRLGSTPQQRRPQAVASAPVAATAPAPASRTPRRGATEVSDPETETDLNNSEWRDSKKDIPVDDSQLVDWQATETTQASDEDFSDIGRKR